MTRVTLLMLMFLVSCDHHWYSFAYKLDEYPDSETGAIETYCRLPGEETVPSNHERVREIHVLWRHAQELYPDRVPAYGSVRVIYAATPDTLVPCEDGAVPWREWPEANGYGPVHYKGFCAWSDETPDGMTWLIVSEFYFEQPAPILAHELAHALFPGLPHGDEHTAVIDSLLIGRK